VLNQKGDFVGAEFDRKTSAGDFGAVNAGALELGRGKIHG
jgi:hypothetical protein